MSDSTATAGASPTSAENKTLQAAHASVVALINHHQEVLKRLDNGELPLPMAVSVAHLREGLSKLLKAKASLESGLERVAQDGLPLEAFPRLRRGMTRAERAAVWDAVDWSKSNAVIARELGVNGVSVGEQRKRRSTQPTRGSSGVMRAKVQQLAREGYASLAIAENLGIALSSVYYHLKQPPVEIEPVENEPESVRERIARLRAAGHSRSRIAELLGVSVNTVKYHTKRINAERPEIL